MGSSPLDNFLDAIGGVISLGAFHKDFAGPFFIYEIENRKERGGYFLLAFASLNSARFNRAKRHHDCVFRVLRGDNIFRHSQPP